ncbi:tRNA 2'-phosphotransferase 1 isoform X2 [Bacillus rossius redtenbacheri]|uniref:tRNA 2'-phosphotransferase 1 isoform X2 n=1 Tax=Bacillus rossius redtenbacheri TaxID=93214 RepID=UPI002FDD0B7F
MSDIVLSKLLSGILRHRAEKEGLEISEEGFVDVSTLLQHRSFCGRFVVDDIKRVVAENDKQRFTLVEDASTGKLRIRANQGHSIKAVCSLELVPILRGSEAPVAIHGTFSRSWDAIRREGLHRRDRLHVHLSPGEPGQAGVVSGMRRSCELYVYVDVGRALADGLKFYRSVNNVILSPGDDQGYIRPKYFSKVVQVSPRKIIMSQDDKDT